MKPRVGVFSCVWVILLALLIQLGNEPARRAGLVTLGSTALAEGIYQYRNKSTGRDVFVNRLDQVPLKYRHGAKLVVEDAPPKNLGAPDEPAPKVETGTVPAAAKQVLELETHLRKVSPVGWRNPSAVASQLVERKLLASGTAPLGDGERGQLKRLLMTILGFALAASLFSFVVWIVVMVVAVRDGRPWWALFIFLFYPLAYLYLFLLVDKGRLRFKAVCAAGLMAPLLVGLVGAWRFSAWLQTVLAARGGG